MRKKSAENQELQDLVIQARSVLLKAVSLVERVGKQRNASSQVRSIRHKLLSALDSIGKVGEIVEDEEVSLPSPEELQQQLAVSNVPRVARQLGVTVTELLKHLKR